MHLIWRVKQYFVHAQLEEEALYLGKFRVGDYLYRPHNAQWAVFIDFMGQYEVKYFETRDEAKQELERIARQLYSEITYIPEENS